MNADEALQFLKDHAPLPDDDDLSDELIAEYDDVRKFFVANPDPRAIGPFLQSFGDGSGYGVYQLVEDVITQFPPEEVVPHLREALRSPHKGVRYWTLEMVSSFPDDSLVGPTAENLTHPDADVRAAAASALSFLGNDDAVRALETALQTEADDDVRQSIEDALQDLRGAE